VQDIENITLSIEVIFGTDDMFRTGSAAGPGTIEEQWAIMSAQKAPYGPGPSSWHRVIQGLRERWASSRGLEL